MCLFVRAWKGGKKQQIHEREREEDGESESQIKNQNCVLVTHFHDVFPSFPPDVPVNDILNTFRLFQEIFVSEGEQKNVFGFHQLQVGFERKIKISKSPRRFGFYHSKLRWTWQLQDESFRQAVDVGWAIAEVRVDRTRSSSSDADDYVVERVTSLATQEKRLQFVNSRLIFGEVCLQRSRA